MSVSWGWYDTKDEQGHELLDLAFNIQLALHHMKKVPTRSKLTTSYPADSTRTQRPATLFMANVSTTYLSEPPHDESVEGSISNAPIPEPTGQRPTSASRHRRRVRGVYLSVLSGALASTNLQSKRNRS